MIDFTCFKTNAYFPLHFDNGNYAIQSFNDNNYSVVFDKTDQFLGEGALIIPNEKIFHSYKSISNDKINIDINGEIIHNLNGVIFAKCSTLPTCDIFPSIPNLDFILSYVWFENELNGDYYNRNTHIFRENGKNYPRRDALLLDDKYFLSQLAYEDII